MSVTVAEKEERAGLDMVPAAWRLPRPDASMFGVLRKLFATTGCGPETGTWYRVSDQVPGG